MAPKCSPEGNRTLFCAVKERRPITSRRQGHKQRTIRIADGDRTRTNYIESVVTYSYFVNGDICVVTLFGFEPKFPDRESSDLNH